MVVGQDPRGDHDFLILAAVHGLHQTENAICISAVAFIAAVNHDVTAVLQLDQISHAPAPVVVEVGCKLNDRGFGQLIVLLFFGGEGQSADSIVYCADLGGICRKIGIHCFSFTAEARIFIVSDAVGKHARIALIFQRRAVLVKALGGLLFGIVHFRAERTSIEGVGRSRFRRFFRGGSIGGDGFGCGLCVDIRLGL